MFNKFKRTNFLSKVETVSGLNEYDMLSSNWDLFEINNPITYDNVLILDLHRPDKLSFRIYGDSQYWWILCKFNHIDDVWNDMNIGDDLIVPSMADIEDFYARVKTRYAK